MVGAVDDVGHGAFGQVGDGVGGGQLHLFVDGGGGGVEGAAEDVGEADDVVDLVGIVGAAGAHEDVGAGCLGLLVRDFGHGVGQGEDDWLRGHGADHVGGQHVAFREADEDVGAHHGFGQGVDVAALGGELAFLFRQVGAVGGDDAFRVEHDDVLLAGAERAVEAGARDGGRPGAVDDDLDLGDVLARHFEGVEQAGGRDDGRPMLVVVHDGDVELFFQAALDFEALGSLDVFKVDAAEGGGDGLDGLDELVGVFLAHFDVEGVDACIDLEQEALALHDGLAGHGADVAQAEDGRAVRDDGHEVALVGVAVGVVRVFLDFEARLGHAGRIGQRQVGLGAVGFGGDDLNLSRPALLVVAQGGFFRYFYHIELITYCYLCAKLRNSWRTRTNGARPFRPCPR